MIKQRLIKLSDEMYIIVDDSTTIKEGDWYYSNLGVNKLGKTTRSVEDWRMKITHSTYLPSEDILPISVSEIEDAIYGFVRERAKESHKYNPRTINEMSYRLGYEDGFNEHEYLLKNKIDTMITNLTNNATSFVPAHVSTIYYKQIEILKTLLPQTEWNVEIVNGKLKLLDVQ